MPRGLQDSNAAARRRSGSGAGIDVIARPAANAKHLRTKVRREAAHERAVQVREAEDAATAHTGASLEQVDPSTALIAIGGQVRVTEKWRFRISPSLL